MDDGYSIPVLRVSAHWYGTGKYENEDRVALVLIWCLPIARGSQVHLFANPAPCHHAGWYLTEAVRGVIGRLQRDGIDGAAGAFWRRKERDVALLLSRVPLAAEECGA